MSGISPDKPQVTALLQGILTNYAPDIVLPLPDGVLSFTYRLVMELVRDCLTKYHLGCITSEYLEDAQKNIRTLVQQAEEKSQSGGLAFFKQLAQNVLFILEGRAHSVEHLALIRSFNTGRKPCMRDYTPIRLISTGSFGSVHLVRQKETNQLCALKKLNKQKLSSPSRLELAFLERDILSYADCPFLVSMICSFPTKDHLCMVMDYVGGGDCGSFLKYNGAIPFTLARMYIAETVLAVEYLHSYGVVHRDLKPDNLLITSTGHIKVADFGLSKVGLMRPRSNIYKVPTEDITREFSDTEMVGAPHFVAPEVILEDGYGKPVDWWSIGIILHQFLVGRVPFRGASKYEIFCSIVMNDITWKFNNYSPPPDAQDIITELLRKNPAHRLGTGGAHEIKTHPFMSDLDFENLLSQRPLYVPELLSDEDIPFFARRYKRHKHVDSGKEDTREDNGWPESHNFVSSTQRHYTLCSTNTRVIKEDPKPYAWNSPESSVKHSDMQITTSFSRTDGDDKCFTGKGRESSSPTSSGFPVQRKRKPEVKQQKTENLEEGERRRGSLCRRLRSSCRRGLSRAVHAIRERWIFAMCHQGTLNIAETENRLM